MNQIAHYEFETPIGVCTIAWREDGAQAVVVGFRLPDVTRDAEQKHDDHVTAPLPQIVEVIARVQPHLRGELQDFRDVRVDLENVQEFARRVLEFTREIPAGKTRTYGEIAKALGRPHAAQAVGQALGSNPVPLIIPCHRVLAAGGKLRGFSAPGGRATKEKLLEIEGACLNRSLFQTQ
jgi:methylated-DNA-[protein]-cysteine S-methyltransferase